MDYQNKMMYRYILIMGIIIAFILGKVWYDNWLLDNSSVETVGVIYKTKTTKNGGFDVYVKFNYNNNKYEATDAYSSKSNYYKMNINDTVIIQFNEDNPDINRIVLLKR